MDKIGKRSKKAMQNVKNDITDAADAIKNDIGNAAIDIGKQVKKKRKNK